MNLIVVVDEKWGIGKNNSLLFRLKKDMKFFRETTSGKVVVMGANTFLSFPNGALPNRTNVVLDASGTQHENTISVSDLEELEKVLSGFNSDDLFIIGGASFYKLMYNRCKTAFVTKVSADGEAEVFFPNLDEETNWQLVEQTDPTDDEGYTISFCKYANTNFGK